MSVESLPTVSPQLTLTIGGTEVVVTYERVPIDDLYLDPQNPRIRVQLEHGGKKAKTPASEEELLEIVREQSGYDDLQKQIRVLGGIFEPIMVRNDGRVIEGNSRLAALKLLRNANRDDAKWATVPITRLPADVPEETVLLLMANFHIAGKTVWRPAAQAEHIYRLIHDHKVSLQRVADETRMTKKKVEQYLKAYEYLIHEVLPEAVSAGTGDRQTIIEKKFSHALEFVAGKKLEEFRQDPEARKSVAKMIATDEISGQEVRKLPELVASKQAIPANAGSNGSKSTSVVPPQAKRADPVFDPKLIKSMKSITETLKSLKRDELNILRADPQAREVLSQLLEAVANVEDFVSSTSRAASAK